jgi:hypothetical protein
LPEEEVLAWEREWERVWKWEPEREQLSALE